MQYEYQTLLLDSKETNDKDGSLTKRLNLLGQNGWELTAILNQHSLGSSQYNLIGITEKYLMVFKRLCIGKEEG